MAILKYERFIVKMSMEQKVRLITSSEFYKSNPVGGYEFPVFEIKNQPYGEECKGLHVTHFPGDAALAAAWNPALTAEVYNAIGEETHAVNSFAYFNCTNDLSAENIIAEHFALGKFLAAKTAGLRRGNGYVNFLDEPSDDENEIQLRRAVRDAVLNEASPNSIILSDLNAVDVVKKRFKYGDLVYGVASTLEEALDFLYSGASYLFLAEDIFDALVNKLTALTKAYRQAHAKYAEDRMTEASFARLVRTFKVFNGEIIDKACDDVIDVLFSMRSAQDEAKPEYRSLKKGEQAYFDEINHNELALLAARQSAVLLKNEGVLPLTRASQVGVIGEFAKDIKYQRGYHNTRSTSEKLPFDVINEYELNTSGFALGYAKGEYGRSDLIDHAVTLADKSDVILLYLAAEKGAEALPHEQLEALNAIAGRRAKIVAVVASSGNIDLSFADKCAAVLLTYVSGQGGAVAALDIITGAVCPGGKLAMPAGLMNGGQLTVKYPVGFGLSYTRFEYGNLKVNESGVSFTVKNTGGCDGYAVPRMYVRKKNTESLFKQKQFKGFSKVFVKQGDAVRVHIPFDDLTFSLYSAEKGYYVEGGLYTVTIGDFPEEEKLSGILLLKDYEEKFSYKNRVVQTAGEGETVEFTEGDLPENVKTARKKLPFALKLTLAIMLAVYVDGIIALFMFGNIISEKGLAFYIILASVAVISTALIIVYICIAAKRRHSEKYLHKNVVLTEMLDNVEEFAEVAKVRYKLPVEEPKPDEPAEEEDGQTAEETQTQELAATYEVSFDDTETGEVARGDKVSFTELCNNLKLFAQSRGINLEMQSARALVAAIASCKIVFLTSKNAELLPVFVKVLNEYYGNDTAISASDEWHTPSDILWNKSGDDKFVLSAFSNAVYSASRAREQERVLIIDNVNITNLGSYFCNFLEYANHPSEEHNITFNEETTVRLPDNLTYVLVPQSGSIDILPSEILNASMITEVMLSRAETATEEQVERKIVSHEDFLLLLAEVKEEYFVTERVWKKVDSLAETINATEKFAIGNKNTIQMESLTSVMMGCGSEESEAVTYMFISKLAYLLKNTRMYRQNGGEKTVYGIIEKLFADEELTKIKRVLTKSLVAQPVAQPSAESAGADAQAQTDGQPAAETAATEAQTDGQTVRPAATENTESVPVTENPGGNEDGGAGEGV